ncbi:MAG: PilZ domain-containing protein [Candidatus Manganitrophaceae bacterium]
MLPSAYERRKFIRVKVNLAARLNRLTLAAMKELSLGGCLIECRLPIDSAEPVEVQFSAEGEIFHMTGRVVHSPAQRQHGIRFESQDEDQIVRLVDLIHKIQVASVARRSARMKVHREAFLDNEPALLTSLSERGCFLHTSRLFHPGDIVEVKFLLEKELYLAAQVRWKSTLGVGVEFLSPEPSQSTDIVHFITKERMKTPV